MPPFKDELGTAAGGRLAQELTAAWPGFPGRRFTSGLREALEPLELLARRDLLAERLVAAMPAPFEAAADVLYRALGSPTFTGWIVEPCTAYVARAGVDQPEVALPLLAALTPRWSSEFAIRPFIERHPVQTYEQLRQWVGHRDEHVRRLVSEGTRPRLPWAPRLQSLVAEPAPSIELLDALVADESPYVRRSVANHLNDIAKDHPSLALEVASRWMGQGDDAAWVVRHGLRTLVKGGDQEALRLLGADVDGAVDLLRMYLHPERVTIGGAVTIEIAIAAAADTAPVEAVIDYRVHYVGARGTRNAPKVFKLTRRRLVPGRPVTIQRVHRFEHVSIRRIHPGCHRIDVQVNGRVIGGADVEISSGDS